jgi:hypothetical protein
MSKRKYPESETLSRLTEIIKISIYEGFSTKKETIDKATEFFFETGEIDDLIEELELEESAAEQLATSYIQDTVEDIWNARLQEESNWDNGYTLYERLRAAFEDLREEHNFYPLMSNGDNHGDATSNLNHLLKNEPDRPYITFHEENFIEGFADDSEELASPYLIFGYSSKKSDEVLGSLQAVILNTLVKHNIKVSGYDLHSVYIDEPWTKKLKTLIIALNPEESDWLNVE